MTQLRMIIRIADAYAESVAGRRSVLETDGVVIMSSDTRLSSLCSIKEMSQTARSRAVIPNSPAAKSQP